MYAYFLLFGASFLAATIMPFSSEVILYTMLQGESSKPILLVAAASGNTLGAAVNWALGRFLLHYRDRPWFYFTQEQVEKWQHWFQKYGIWSLLMAWLPLGGDVLTFIAGVMKVNFWVFLILVGVGKTARYVVIFLLA